MSTATVLPPCAHCGHKVGRHNAMEGMCLDCCCDGWAPGIVAPQPRRADGDLKIAVVCAVYLGIGLLAGYLLWGATWPS